MVKKVPTKKIATQSGVGGKSLKKLPTIKKVALKKVTPLKKAVSKSLANTNKTATKPKFINHSTKLKVGNKAPVFEAKDQHGNLITSKSLLGKTIVLYFYPKDDTPTTT